MEVDTDDDEKTLNVKITTMNLENAEEPMNNDAKICSPEISDIFPIFVNMLDAKSFMNLAMTCKGMYKRCMEDKAIKINVNEKKISVCCDEGGVGLAIQSSFVSERNLKSYVATLRKQRFSLSVGEVSLNGTPDENIPIFHAASHYLKDIGVNKVEKLHIYQGFPDWEAIFPFIKEFDVRILSIHCTHLPHPILRSLLQLDLDQFDYGKTFPVDIFLEMDTPIPKIEFDELEDVEWDKFMQMSWKIQSGALQRLTVSSVNWMNDEPLKYDEENELPEHRPLVFKRNTDRFVDGVDEYFFLHWQGGVTKCVIESDIEIFKCPPNEFPPILRKDEDVLKDLSEMLPKVSCYERHFNTFMETFTLIEPSYEGPLPPERPLYLKTENGFCKLSEDGELMECAWRDGLATWKPFDYAILQWHLEALKTSPFGYRALLKLMFIERLQEPDKYFGEFDCERLEEFDFWLEDYKKLDFEYAGPLPEERPLLFEKAPSEDGKFCVILFGDHILQCELSGNKVEVEERCKPWNRPSILIDANAVQEFLEELFIYKRENVSILVDHETFLNGFELFKTSSSKRHPVVFERTQEIDGKLVEERWFFKFGGLSKITWKDGYASLSDGDSHEFPPQFEKQLFNECVREFSIKSCWGMPLLFPGLSSNGLSMDLKQLENCLEQYETHPFDYCGPLSKDRNLAFVKKEIHHICEDVQDTLANCGCTESSFHVWFLSDGVEISYCSWSAKKPQQVMFTSCKDFPPFFKSKLYLESLLQTDEAKEKSWRGSLDDFLACFENYTKISSSHKGPLPEERPLLLEKDANVISFKRYLLREDGRIVESRWYGSGVIIETIHPFSGYPPCVLMSAW